MPAATPLIPARSLPAGAQVPSELLCQGKQGHGHNTERSRKEEEDTAFPTGIREASFISMARLGENLPSAQVQPTGLPADHHGSPNLFSLAQYSLSVRGSIARASQANKPLQPFAIKNLHHPLTAFRQLNFSNFTHPCSLCTDFSRDLSRLQRKIHRVHTTPATGTTLIWSFPYF